MLKVISRSTFDLQAVLRHWSSRRATMPGGKCQIFLYGEVYRSSRTMVSRPNIRSTWSTIRLRRAEARRWGEQRSKAAPSTCLMFLPIRNITWHEGRSSLDFARCSACRCCEREAVGVMSLTRGTPEPFTAQESSSSTTFADQAVIAIENVRLFDEVQARTEELSESLQQQTASADVLKVISRSAFDLQPIFDALVESAVRLCEAERASSSDSTARFSARSRHIRCRRA